MATELEVLKTSITNLKEQLTPLLGADTDKFIQIACNFMDGKTKLLSASRPSLFSEIIKAAQQRLFLDGQEASLVPFKEMVKLMVGYKGILKMVRNSGELASINAGVVYEKDTFEYFVDEKGEHLKHMPTLGKDRGKPSQTYCIARIKGGNEPYIEVMSEEEVMSCKKVSRAGDDSPWNGPFADEMRKKTVIRRISKRLPMSTDLNMAINDEEFEEPVAEPVQEPKTTSTRLEQAVAPVAPATDKPDHPQAPQLEQALSQTVRGFIEAVGAKPMDKGGFRYWVKLSGVFYGTFSETDFRKCEDLFNKKVPVIVMFVTKLTKDKKEFNDLLNIMEDVKEDGPSDNDVPI